MGLYVFLGCVVAIVLWAALTFNSLVRARNRADESWSDVDVQLRRRHDLVPSLVEAVKGYAAHELHVLVATTEARTTLTETHPGAHLERAETDLSDALTDLWGVAERNPELNASDQFQLMQRRLAEVENEIRAARRIFNSNVEAYNVRVQSLPSSLIATAGSFRPRRYFEVAPSTAMPLRALHLAA
jgi:LemA protein